MTDVLMAPLFTLVLAYLLGSFPSGYLAGRWLKGVDIRTLGSGSIGATNVLRQIGKGPALVVFLIDVLKGTAAVLLAKALGFNDWWVVASGLAALAGHIWPIWLGWRGGKAVATGLGMLLGLAWPVGLACFGVFLTVISVSRIVSLSSVLSALSLPLLMLARFASLGEAIRPAYLSLSIVAAVLVIWRHRSNLSRIAAGTEPRLGDKKKEA